eukprot:SAG31_NODE_1681_length_7537_cov_71.109572_5_plen_68_part_00
MFGVRLHGWRGAAICTSVSGTAHPNENSLRSLWSECFDLDAQIRLEKFDHVVFLCPALDTGKQYNPA